MAVIIFLSLDIFVILKQFTLWTNTKPFEYCGGYACKKSVAIPAIQIVISWVHLLFFHRTVVESYNGMTKFQPSINLDRYSLLWLVESILDCYASKKNYAIQILWFFFYTPCWPSGWLSNEMKLILVKTASLCWHWFYGLYKVKIPLRSYDCTTVRRKKTRGFQL